MAVSRSRPFVALAVCLFLCGGCAASRRGALADRFVKPGTSAVDLGGPAPQAKRAPDAGPKQAQPPLGFSRPASLGLSVENSDKRLSAALLLETIRPSAENHLRVAEEYRRLGILDTSARHLDEALRLSPHFSAAHEGLARIWRDWGFPERGLGAAYRATVYAPRSPSAHNTLGTLFAALGQTDNARHAYERALALSPSAWVLSNLCDLERQAGRLQTAVDRCRAALAIDPSLSAAHNNLALTLVAAGDPDGAGVEFLAAGDAAAGNYNIGLMHLADGDYRRAADAFETAIQLRPSFTAAKTRAHAARLYLLTGGK
jgi:tetratricopeptide (TPR) repeat protein